MSRDEDQAVKTAMGMRLRLRREALNLSQQEVADALGINRVTYTLYETGRNAVPVVDLQRLARVLRCSVSYFFDAAPADTPDEQDRALAVQAIHQFTKGLAPRIQYLVLADLIRQTQQDMFTVWLEDVWSEFPASYRDSLESLLDYLAMLYENSVTLDDQATAKAVKSQIRPRRRKDAPAPRHS